MAILGKNAETIAAKEAVVAELKDKLQRASGMVVLDYMGLTVGQDTEMRNSFRAANVEYMVVKNRMMKLALNALGYTEFDESLNGPTAVAISYNDVVAPAKIVSESIRKYNKMSIKAGLAEGKFASKDEVDALAKIPSKEVLIGQLLGMLTSPMRSLAVVLSEHAKQLG